MKYIEIAKSLVEELNKNYSTAFNELQATVGALENALKQILPELKFELFNYDDDYSGTIFRLIIDANPSDNKIERIRVTDFYVPSNGYPISIGLLRKKGDTFETERTVYSKEEIEAYLESLTNSNDSRIIQTIGFALRRKTNLNDDIPF